MQLSNVADFLLPIADEKRPTDLREKFFMFKFPHGLKKPADKAFYQWGSSIRGESVHNL